MPPACAGVGCGSSSSGKLTSILQENQVQQILDIHLKSQKFHEISCVRRCRHARALDIADRMSTGSMVGGALQLARHHRAPALEERLTALQEGRLALEAADAAAAAQQARLPAVPPAATSHQQPRPCPALS